MQVYFILVKETSQTIYIWYMELQSLKVLRHQGIFFDSLCLLSRSSSSPDFHNVTFGQWNLLQSSTFAVLKFEISFSFLAQDTPDSLSTSSALHTGINHFFKEPRILLLNIMLETNPGFLGMYHNLDVSQFLDNFVK